MKTEKLRGIICPMLTPFTKDGEIDKTLFRKEVRYILSTGVHGISPGGSTGEGATLTDDELACLITIIKEENIMNIPIVAGIIRNSTKSAINTSLMAKRAGADALMVTPTHYNVLVPNDKGNFDFYKKISDEVGLPIIIYNVVPQNTISTALFSIMLDNIENVVGVKQSVGGIQALYDMQYYCGDRGLIYCATDEMMYTGLNLKVDGVIAAIVTAFPEYSIQMWDALQKGDDAGGNKLQRLLYPVWMTVKGEHFPMRLKEVVRQLGRQPGYCRSPLLDLEEVDKNQISNCLAKYLSK